MDAKLKHLEFVQGVINRLSTNSFLLKGWSVVLVSAIIAAGSQRLDGFVYLALLPAAIFWGLDGYFLRNERAYRKLYDSVRTKNPDDIDFCMDPKPFYRESKGWWNAVLSPSLSIFHVVLIIAIVVAMFYPLGD